MRGRAITTALLFAAAPLAGQTLQDYCNGTIPVTIGRWAAYKFTGGRSNGTTMRMAIVSSEKVGDSTYYWYEMQMHTMRGNKPIDGYDVRQQVALLPLRSAGLLQRVGHSRRGISPG